MTTYKNDELIPNVTLYEKLNPYYGDSLIKEFGSFNLGTLGPLQQYIPFGVVYGAAGGVAVVDYPDRFPGYGDSKLDTALVKIKYLTGQLHLTDQMYKAYQQNNPMAVAVLDDQMQKLRGVWDKTLNTWIIGYASSVTASTNQYYDPAWVALLHAKAATGTILDPEDINSTAGTVQDYTAEILTGTNKTLDFVEDTFGASIDRFGAMMDSTTGEQMLTTTDPENAAGSNDFLAIMHPTLVRKFNFLHPKVGTNDEPNITFAQQITQAGVRMRGSINADAALAVTEDGTDQVLMVANPKLNFKVGTSNLQIEPWEYESHQGVKVWYQNVYQPIVCWRRPYYINGSWKKALHHFQFTYLNDAG
jgi:hypothetical protein